MLSQKIIRNIFHISKHIRQNQTFHLTSLFHLFIHHFQHFKQIFLPIFQFNVFQINLMLLQFRKQIVIIIGNINNIVITRHFQPFLQLFVQRIIKQYNLLFLFHHNLICNKDIFIKIITIYQPKILKNP